MVFPGFSANVSLEELDALYPGGLETIPYSLDATRFAGGDPLFFVVNTSNVVSTLSGDNLAAQIRISPIAIEPGRRVRIRGARLVTDAEIGRASCRERVCQYV